MDHADDRAPDEQRSAEQQYPLTFNDLLRKVGCQLDRVRLLRHKEPGALRGRSPYELWRDDRPAFEVYQAQHGEQPHQRLVGATNVASFVGTPQGETMFVGFYRSRYAGLSQVEVISPTTNKKWEGDVHLYELALEAFLSEYIGRLFICWDGARAYIRRFDRKEWPITEIRLQFTEPAFPGYLHFVSLLSQLTALPKSWIEMLRGARGIYVLTCPRTREQYIGEATGVEGFLGRWTQYARDGHGGNIQLKSRDPSDYQVSILEVAGSSATDAEISALEMLWKAKLQTRQMGLNSN
jgi:hypothetical protein